MMLVRLVPVLVFSAGIVACSAGLPSRVDRNWGSAQRDNTAAMIENPLGTDPEHDPGTDMDGPTVEGAVRAQRLRERQRGAPAPAPSTINIGTVGR